MSQCSCGREGGSRNFSQFAFCESRRIVIVFYINMLNLYKKIIKIRSVAGRMDRRWHAPC